MIPPCIRTANSRDQANVRSSGGTAVNLPATIEPAPLDLPTLDKATKEGALKSLPVRTFFRVWEAYARGQPQQDDDDKEDEEKETEGEDSKECNIYSKKIVFRL